MRLGKNHRWSASPGRSPGPASKQSASLTDIPREKQMMGAGFLLYFFYRCPKSWFGLRALSMCGPSVLWGRFQPFRFVMDLGLRWWAACSDFAHQNVPRHCCGVRRKGSLGRPRELNSAAKTHSEVMRTVPFGFYHLELKRVPPSLDKPTATPGLWFSLSSFP